MDWSLNIPSKPVKLPLDGKYIIFSDLHRDRFMSRAGDFWRNADLYDAALKYYLENGFTLIENGDGEELWQFSLREIINSYKSIYKKLGNFHKEKRLHMVYGNHNVDMKFRIFHRYWTDKHTPNIKYHPMLLIGDHILVTHGHQWDLVYKLGFIPVRLIVRLWKYMEYLGLPSFDPSIPAANPDQGKKIDKRIIKWGRGYGYVMVCGHTHHAKFLSNGEYYFNSGCGVVEDRLTGLEINNGEISLIRWGLEKNGEYRRKALQKTVLPLNRRELKKEIRKEKFNENEYKIMTVFGGSNAVEGDELYKLAFQLGEDAAKNGYVIKNGGYGGTMIASAEGARKAGGKVIGVTIKGSSWGDGNQYLSEEIESSDLFERLRLLIKNVDVIVVLPGSTGTQSELMLTIEMLYKGLLKKVPLILLGKYWDDVIEEAKKLVPGIEKLFLKAHKSEDVFRLIESYKNH